MGELISKLSPWSDTVAQRNREQRTSLARIRAINAQKKTERADLALADVDARLDAMRRSYERAGERLAAHEKTR